MTTKIEWADATINPVVGCSHCSPGCDHCFAERFAARLAKNPKTADKYRGVVDEHGKWTGKLSSRYHIDPIFNTLPKKPARIFVGSMCDIFHDNMEYPAFLHIIRNISKFPNHTFIFLTKRPERMKKFISLTRGTDTDCGCGLWPLPNVWLGVTVCNQDEADAKIPVLLQTPAAVRFVSVEPMLGPVDLGKYMYGCYECGLSCGTRMALDELPEIQCRTCGLVGPDNYETWGDGDFEVCPKCDGTDVEPVCPDCGHYMVREHPDTPVLDWVICGGETGPDARPMNPRWVEDLQDQCSAAEVPFFFKSFGEWAECDSRRYFPDPEEYTWRDAQGIPTTVYRVGKRRAGRLLDGRMWNEFPEESC